LVFISNEFGGIMKNLRNINHWIAELRTLANAAKVFNEDDNGPMTKKQIDAIFNKQNFSERFIEGLTPKEAFENEMEEWLDAPYNIFYNN